MISEETISGFFEKDHDEIDAILAAVDFERPAESVPRFAEFDQRLERHIVWEEDVLFPAAVRTMPPLADGPIAVMREEHKIIRRHKLEALAALRAGDGKLAQRCVRQMLDTLGDHNNKEEEILYPMCDRVLAGPETGRILAVVKGG